MLIILNCYRQLDWRSARAVASHYMGAFQLMIGPNPKLLSSKIEQCTVLQVSSAKLL